MAIQDASGGHRGTSSPDLDRRTLLRAAAASLCAAVPVPALGRAAGLRLAVRLEPGRQLRLLVHVQHVPVRVAVRVRPLRNTSYRVTGRPPNVYSAVSTCTGWRSCFSVAIALSIRSITAARPVRGSGWRVVVSTFGSSAGSVTNPVRRPSSRAALNRTLDSLRADR